MAGIGFELKKIYGRGTLAANLWGTVYATMTTIGPAVLSAVLLLLLKMLLDQAGLTVLESRFFISAVTWAFLLAMLVAVLFAAPVSRYISDCIYLEQESDICPSAFGVLGLSTAVSGLVMFLLCAGVYNTHEGVPLAFLVSYYFLGVLVTDAFSLMTYASALKHYRTLTFSFFLGLLIALAVYFACYHLGVERVTAGCVALVCCYFVVVFTLVLQCVRAFGLPQGRYFAFLSYFRRYPRLAVAGAAYTMGLYCPTIIYWFFSGMAEHVNIFTTTPVYDIALFMAVVVNMPALVIFVVKVETSFYEKYTLYVSALNNGSHALIQKEREAMARTLRHHHGGVGLPGQRVLPVSGRQHRHLAAVRDFEPGRVHRVLHVLHRGRVLLLLRLHRCVHQHGGFSRGDGAGRRGCRSGGRFLPVAPVGGWFEWLGRCLFAATPADGSARQLSHVHGVGAWF